jgi:putative FmdB family regulatory protein
VPLYTYHCNHCRTDFERTVKLEERDNQRCHGCNGQLERSGVERFAVGKARYQMQAVLADGRHVKGHFGKTAVLDKTKRARRA